jgi:hypothetical protein
VAGKKCSSVVKILQDIFNGEEIRYIPDFADFYPNTNLLHYIYCNSLVDQNIYYETCALISSKTSNNQKDCENMEFYVFNNLMIYLNKIIDAENGTKNGTTDENQNQNNPMQTAQQVFGSSMKQTKSLFKMPTKLK